jgi:hypothetical protein
VDLLPGSIVAPTAENSVDGLPIREVVRKESPSAAAAQEIEELSPFYQPDYHVFADRMPDTVCVYRLLAKTHRGNRFNHALVVPGGKSLDVGCGLGTLVAGMARLGMEAEGIASGSLAQASMTAARSGSFWQVSVGIVWETKRAAIYKSLPDCGFPESGMGLGIRGKGLGQSI